MRRPQLENELVLFTEVDLLQVRALDEVPEMQPAAVSAAQQDLGNETVLDRVGCAPFAGHQRVVAEVPPAVIGELLRPAVDLPAAERLEALMINDEDTARGLAVLIAQRRDINAARSAMDRMRAGIAGLLGDFARFDRFDQSRLARIGLGVEDVDAR